MIVNNIGGSMHADLHSCPDKEKAGEGKGRVLKIKTGYNPNSSSIGVDMIAFFTAGAALTVLFNTVASIIFAAKGRQDGGLEKLPGGAPKPTESDRLQEQR
jgi:hypothetical protein